MSMVQNMPNNNNTNTTSNNISQSAINGNDNTTTADSNNLQLQLVSNLNKKHEILTILQLCKSHLKLQQYNTTTNNNNNNNNTSLTTDLLINNYLYLINKLNYKPFQVIWNLSKIYQQKDLYHLAVSLLKEYLDANQSKIKYEDPFDEFIKQDISIQDLQLIQLDQDDQDSDDLIISEVWASLGHCYLMIEDLPNAYLTYQKALYILPNVKCSKLWKGIGVLYDRYGSLDYAEEAFAKVLEIENSQDTLLKEDQNEIYFRLGIIYKHQNKYQQSLECFRFIINNPPPPLKECDIWFQLGQVCELMQDYENAKLAYTECCLLNGNHHKGWICLAVMYLVLQEAKIDSYMEQGLNIEEEIGKNEDVFFEETKMALQCLNNHLRIDANDTLCWYYLGRAHLLLRDYQTSYEYYQNCINKDPNNANFWCSIGILYYAIGQFHDSLDAYSRAIRLNPYLWEVWYDLGVLYEACGDEEQQFKDAIDAFTQADRLRPGYAAIEYKLKQLSGQQVDLNKSLPKWLEPELPFQQTPQQNPLPQPQAQFPLEQPLVQEQEKPFSGPVPITTAPSTTITTAPSATSFPQPVEQRNDTQPSATDNNNNSNNNVNVTNGNGNVAPVSVQEPTNEVSSGNSLLNNKGLDTLVAAAAMSHNNNNTNITTAKRAPPINNVTTNSTPASSNSASASNGLANLAPGPKKRGRKPKSVNSASSTPMPEDSTQQIQQQQQQQSGGVKKRGRPLGRKNKVNVDIASLAPINPLPTTHTINNNTSNGVLPAQNSLLHNKTLINANNENRLPMFNSVLNRVPSMPSSKGVKLNLAELAAVSVPSQAQKQSNGIVSIAPINNNSNNNNNNGNVVAVPPLNSAKDDNRLLNLVRAAESHSFVPPVQQEQKEKEKVVEEKEQEKEEVVDKVVEKEETHGEKEKEEESVEEKEKRSIEERSSIKSLMNEDVDMEKQGEKAEETQQQKQSQPEPQQEQPQEQSQTEVSNDVVLVENPEKVETVSEEKKEDGMEVEEKKEEQNVVVEEEKVVEDKKPVEEEKTVESAVKEDSKQAVKEDAVPAVTTPEMQKSEYEVSVEEEVEDLPKKIDVEVGEVIRNVEEDENYDD